MLWLINGLWGENSRTISNWCLPISNDWVAISNYLRLWHKNSFCRLTRLSYKTFEGFECLDHHSLVFTPYRSRWSEFYCFSGFSHLFAYCSTCQRKRERSRHEKILEKFLFLFSNFSLLWVTEKFAIVYLCFGFTLRSIFVRP